MQIKNYYFKIMLIAIFIMMLASCGVNRNVRENGEFAERLRSYPSDVETLKNLLLANELLVQELQNTIEYLQFAVDSLNHEIELTSSRIFINDTFEEALILIPALRLLKLQSRNVITVLPRDRILVFVIVPLMLFRF